MKILKDTCIGCGACISSCPMKAMKMSNGLAEIDSSKCVECYNCVRTNCPVEAIVNDTLVWPMTLVESLSNPIGVDEKSGVSGRGTAEMKTNEVTGRIGHNDVGICLEFGRPGTGTSFIDVEKGCVALAKHGVFFEPLNPVTYVMVDTKTGKLQDDVRNIRVLSAIVEALVPADQLESVLKTCQQLAKEIDTVFSMGVSSLVKSDGSTYFDETLTKMGLTAMAGGKTNVGLGTPTYNFEGGNK